MRKQSRKQLPVDLAAAMRTKRMGKDGKWPVFQKQRINQHLLPLLRNQAENRCSYCGTWPMQEGASDETIDHFRPKAQGKFPTLALTWENLLLACNGCQRAKGDKWHDHFLDPSEPGYEFLDWYVWNTHSAELEPRHPRGTTAYRRAQAMICACRINRAGVVALRKRLRTQQALRNYRLRVAGEAPNSATGQPGDWPF